MRRIPLLMVITSVLAGLGIVQMTFLIGHGLYRHFTWTAETRALQQETVQLRRDLVTLQGVYERAVSGEYLAELARCQGFVGEKERVVVDERAAVASEGNCEPVRLP